MKKILSFAALFLMITLLFSSVCLGAEDQYSFLLQSGGEEFLEVSPGQTVSVTVTLKRQKDSSYAMHGMQAELRYDPTFLEFIPGNSVLFTGVNEKDIALQDGRREHYLNFLSFSGGTQWKSETLVATVQFRVVGTSGVSKIENMDFLVSLPDGTGSYPCTSNSLTLMVSTDCTVTFHSKGGSEVAPQTVQYGEKIVKPQDPVREGYTFAGWYKDLLLTDPWDFDRDVVEENMSLFAKWTEGGPATLIPEEPQSPCCLCWIIGLGILLLLILFIIFLILIFKRKKKKEEADSENNNANLIAEE